jgi:hypothetical protein
LSYANKNHTVVTLGDDIVYSAGKYLVIYRKDAKSTPRMRISKPDITVVGVTSMTTAPDHSRVAAAEHLETTQRITFWDSDMRAVQQPIAGNVKVRAREHGWLESKALHSSSRSSNMTGSAGGHCSQGHLWDLAWSQDCQYIAGSTVRPGEGSDVHAPPSLQTAEAEGSWKSCIYYWRGDGSLVCSVECQHSIKKIIVDPANSAYIISLGTGGQV